MVSKTVSSSCAPCGLPDSSASLSPLISSHRSTCTGPRRDSRPVRSRTATFTTRQSLVRVGSMAASTSTAALPESSRTRASSSCPTTRTSLARWWNCRRFTDPVASVTAFGSMALTRSMGTKIRRRVASSSTMPSTRGGWRSRRSPMTMSRALPMDSPSGPNTGRPAS